MGDVMATTITTKDVNKAIQAVKALNINPVLQTQLIGALQTGKTTLGKCQPCGSIEAWK